MIAPGEASFVEIRMDFESVWNFSLVSFSDGSKLTVGMLALAMLVLLVGFLLSMWVARIVGKRLVNMKLGPDNAAVLQKLTFIFLLVITVILVLSMLNVPVTAGHAIWRSALASAPRTSSTISSAAGS